MYRIHDKIKSAGKFARASLQQGKEIAKGAWDNRDLVTRGLGIASVVGAGAVGGGPLGAIGAGLSQAGDIADLKKDIKSRREGRSKRNPITDKDIDKIKKSGSKIIGGQPKKKMDSSRLQQLKQLAQGQQL